MHCSKKKTNSDVSDVKRSCSCKLMKQRVMYMIFPDENNASETDNCDRDRLEVKQKEPEILSI